MQTIEKDCAEISPNNWYLVRWLEWVRIARFIIVQITLEHNSQWLQTTKALGLTFIVHFLSQN